MKIFFSKECPKYSQLKEQVLKSDEYTKLNSENQVKFKIDNLFSKQFNFVYKIGFVWFNWPK